MEEKYFEKDNIKLYCDNALERLKQIPSKSIDLIATDPPYDISATNRGGTINNVKKLNKSLQDLVVANITNGYDIETYGNEFLRILKEPNIYLWCNKKQIPEYFNFYVNKHKCQFDMLVWHKCLHSSTFLAVKDKDDNLKNMPIKDIFRSSDYTKIKVYDGIHWVNIQNIIPNTNVNKYLIIKLRNGNEIKCTQEHKFSVNKKLVKATDLIVGQVLDNVQIENKPNYPIGITNEMQWFIGHYIAEGNKNTRQNEISISTNKNNIIVETMIKKICEQYSALYSIYDNYGSENSRIIRIRSKIIKGIIEEFVSGDLAYGKHLSTKCWNTNNSFLNNVLQGYLDGDGCYDKDNDRYRLTFTGKNYSLMRDLTMICNILNYKINFSKGHTQFNGKNFRIFRGEIRKCPSKLCRSSYEIISIDECINNGNCFYDICLNNDNHMFSLYDGTLTHNCNALPTYSNKYLSDTEYLLYFRKGKGKCFPQSYEDAKTYYYAPINHKDKKEFGHPTIKPLDITEKIIRNSSRENDLILDPFCGSGTTAVACQNLNRKFIGIEIEQKWFDSSKNRIIKNLK